MGHCDEQNSRFKVETTHAFEMIPIPAPAINRPTVKSLGISLLIEGKVETYAEDPTTTICKMTPTVTKKMAVAKPPFRPEKSLQLAIDLTCIYERTHPTGPAAKDPTTSPTWMIETQRDWSELEIAYPPFGC